MHTPEIIYEDNHLIVLNKPFGMPSQGDQTGDLSIFDWTKEYIRVTYNKPGNIYTALLHRIDRPVGGVMVLGKTSKAASRMSKAFQERKVQKTYWAITENIPASENGVLENYLKKLGGKNIMRAYDKNVHHSKFARLSYKTLRVNDGKALLEIKPETGRRHQIRVQLSAIKCTIKGDVKYGKTKFNEDKCICLIAKKISFEHPTKKELVTFEVDYPTAKSWSAFAE